MKEPRRYAAYEMSELEDSVCRAFHFANMAKMVVEYIISLDEGTTAMPLSRSERESLWFAAAEAAESAEAAKAEFYKLGEETI